MAINDRPRGSGGQRSRSQEAKVRLEAWQRYHSQLIDSSRSRHTVSNGYVALEKGVGVLHIVLTTLFVWRYMRLAGALVFIRHREYWLGIKFLLFLNYARGQISLRRCNRLS